MKIWRLKPNIRWPNEPRFIAYPGIVDLGLKLLCPCWHAISLEGPFSYIVLMMQPIGLLPIFDRPPEMGELSAADKARLEQIYHKFVREADHLLGYPTNSLFDYSTLLPFLAFGANNVGDPFLASNLGLNTHDLERELVEIFCRLTQGPRGDTWGYVTNGGTEGNMYGLFLARERFPEGIVYYSEDSHYSIAKILRVLKIRSLMIRSLPDGRMDLDDLRETVHIERHKPAIMVVNVGTTMKGATDDLEGIKNVLTEVGITQNHLHIDAALSGMLLPFMDDAPPWNFAHGADTLSISGHKMIGSPIPCGIALARRELVDLVASGVEYIGSRDTTLSGSRNGITPIFLWYAFHTIGEKGFREWVGKCQEITRKTVEILTPLGRHPWAHEKSITVVFHRPSQGLIRKWQLATEGPISHIICMPHVNLKRIQRFADDLQNDTKSSIPSKKGLS